MKYQNLKTGAVINSTVKLSGPNWVEVGKTTKEKPEQPVVAEVEKTVSPPPKMADEEINGITVKQIKQELDAFGIEYDPKAKKKELYDLMKQGK